MKDEEIRLILKKNLQKRYGNSLPIIEEFKIEKGMAYPDLVAFFKQPHCYEIKSQYDSLTRLERQVHYYSQCFGKITIICAPKHTQSAISKSPYWIAVWEVDDAGNLICKRKGQKNPDYKSLKFLDFLWKEELLNVEKKLELASSPKRFSKNEIIENIKKSKKTESILKISRNELLLRMENLNRLIPIKNSSPS